MPENAERRIPPVFPSRQTLFSGRRLTARDMLTIDKLVGEHGPLAGYLVAEGDHDALYLLFLKGKPHSAGLYRDGRFEPITLRSFFSQLAREGEPDRSFDLFAVDTAVLLLVAAQIQRRPVLSVTADLASPEEVLAKVETAGRDAVIAIIDGALRHVVFCQGGVPRRFHAASEVSIPTEDVLSEAVTVFCFERSGQRPVTLEVFDDLSIEPASDHGLPFSAYVAQGGQVLRYELTLFVNDQKIETRVMTEQRCVLGRGEGVDVQLDDSAVSREHAEIQWRKGSLVLRDLGSDNGTRINNAPLSGEPVLRSGDEIGMGRCRLVFKLSPQRSSSSVDETLHLDPGTLGARVVYQGQTFPILDSGLVIGAGAEADILVRGALVRPKQARIRRLPDGHYWVEHLGGWRKLRVNRCTAVRQALRTGDAIVLAGETMRFYDAH